MFGACLHCRKPMKLPDHFAACGGSIACPYCLRTSTFAPIVAAQAGPREVDPGPDEDESSVLGARRGSLVLVAIAGSFFVALWVPWIGLGLGVAIVVAALAVLTHRAGALAEVFGVTSQSAGRRRLLAACGVGVGVLTVLLARTSAAASGASVATTEIDRFAARERDAALAGAAPLVTQRLLAATTEARSSLAAAQVDAAATALDGALALARTTTDQRTAPGPLVLALDEATRTRALVERVRSANAAVTSAVAHEEAGDKALARRRYADAHELYAMAVAELGIDEPMRAHVKTDVVAARARVAAKHARITRAAARQRKR